MGRVLTFPPPEMGGARISQPPRVAAAAQWYDPNGAFAADGGNLYAWRAQNSVGTIWPGGPANYAATLTDQCSGQVLVEGNGAVPWAAATGWGFVAASLKYFNTNLIPTNDQSWSIFGEYANDATVNGVIAGAYGGVGSSWFILRPNVGGLGIYRGNGGTNTVAPILATGNIGVAGNLGYRNGVQEGGALPVWNQPSVQSVFVGARNNAGVPAFYCTAQILAVWVYDQNPALVQAQAVLADGFRAAMGQL